MTRKPTVDGFIPRRSPGEIGAHHAPTEPRLPRPSAYSGLKPTGQGLNREQPSGLSGRSEVTPARQVSGPAHSVATTATPAPHVQPVRLGRSDVDESLREIDQTPAPAPVRKKRARGLSSATRRKLIKRIIIAILVILLAIGAWIAVRAVIASSSVFKGDLFGLVQSAPLKADENGRSNILIFGTSEDDPEHEGALLTDSIMVLSINQTKKDAFMVSIPRDLWVKFGVACNSGYEGKINELYNCFSNGGESPEEGAKALADEVGSVLGLSVQYHAHLNYTVVRQAVDAVGGVDVEVMGNGPVPAGVKPGSILDRNFDWKCNYQCYYVKYEPGTHHMDGEHALAFMRARNAQGGYGLANSNFDREKNQQKVMVALRNKALSAGTLANPGKVTGLLDALGDNLRTNFETKEIRTLMSLGTDIKPEAIKSIALDDEKDPQMAVGAVGGASVVRPVLGLYDYSGVARYIQKQFSADPVVLEGASVVVLNGSGVPGAAKTAADKLEAMGFTITGIDNAPADDYQRREVYQRSDTAMPGTRKKLTGLYGQPKMGVDRFGVDASVDFVIVVGQAGSSDQ